MRILSDHIVSGDQASQLKVSVLDEPGQGGACHKYHIDIPGDETGIHIDFQNGPIAEVGVNGITNEALTAILIDRMHGFQSGQFACQANALALGFYQNALFHLQARTRERIARGVEGTHKQ